MKYFDLITSNYIVQIFNSLFYLISIYDNVFNFGFRFDFEPKFRPKPKDVMIPKPKPKPKPKVSGHESQVKPPKVRWFRFVYEFCETYFSD